MTIILLVISMTLIVFGVVIALTSLITVKQTDMGLVERFEDTRQCYQIFDVQKLRRYDQWK